MEPGNDVEEAEAPGDVASTQEEQAAGQPPASNLEEEEVVEGDDTCVRGAWPTVRVLRACLNTWLTCCLRR